jgi:hypothetical protein
MAFLLKRRDGRDIAKKLYCSVQNGTYGQPNYLLADLPYTVHSCSRHGVVAVRLTAVCMARQRYTPFKNIYCVGCTLIAWTTLGRPCAVPPHLPAPPPPPSNMVTTIFAEY